jgi:hypothetical protein
MTLSYMKSPKERRRGRRGRTPLPDDERKDRLVQTRVDEGLDEALRDAAKQRRVTVSQLIRNVLEDTFVLVDNVVADAAALGAAVKRDAKRVADAARGVPREVEPEPTVPARRPKVRDPLDVPDAWQEVFVGRDQLCARCGKALARGDRALMGITAEPGSPPWLCMPCAVELRVVA